MLLLPSLSFAGPDEGMWLPFYLKQQTEAAMKKLGLRLDACQIYDTSEHSLKDAIVSLGGGSCTGGFISGQGLLFTNHHCGYDGIAAHSTKERDLLGQGFWAHSLGEELPNPGLTASVLLYTKDVTDIIRRNTDDVRNQEIRQIKISILIDSIEKVAAEGDRYKAEVKPYFKGNKYYLMVSEVFRDVRLVGAPPAAIGKFGGEADNWMYPRHTGDFCMASPPNTALKTCLTAPVATCPFPWTDTRREISLLFSATPARRSGT
jgi:hypothetical protein